MNENNKRIAKNTLFLYFRMLFSTVVSLYTSRIILSSLGVDDFGLYQTVGGIVGLISFANAALTMGSSRFLTYELGTNDFEKLKKTFSTSFYAHVLLSLIIVLVLETVGLWYVYNELVVGESRLDSAVFVFHISVITSIITITQVPYSASIVSHEKIKIYAYVGVVEVCLKLGVAYLLSMSNFDKLKFYAVLLLLIHCFVAVYYRMYCVKNFKECCFSLIFDRKILKNILSYSGWNLIASTSIALCNHGILVLMNAFFSPAVVASKAISNQVILAANQFVGNFKLAVDPQIVKQYAAGRFNESRTLLLESAKVSYFMMLMLCVPICMTADYLLKIWLGIVPELATEFLQIAVVTSLVETLNRSFYTALFAKGRIKENANIYSAILFISFIAVFILFELDFSPVSSMVVLFFAQFIMGVVVKPYLLFKIVDYPIKPVFNTLLDCLKVSLIALPIPLIVHYAIEKVNIEDWMNFLVQVFFSVSSVACSVWFFGFSLLMRKRIVDMIKKRINY